MSNLNFDNIADKSAGYVQPGTIAIFKLEEVEVTTAKSGTQQIKVVFKNKEGDFYNHWFAWTAKAAVNINHLVKNATGDKLTGEATIESVAAKLKGTKVAMKLSGKIDQNKGIGYADLSFASFAAPADELDSLKFTGGEQAKIAAALSATGSAASADNDSVSAIASNDEF